MSVVEKYLGNNADYAAEYADCVLPMASSLHVAVVACMDARINVYAALGLAEGEAYVIRNAGGVITDDQLRSLAIAQHLMGVKEIVLLHHTDCGMLKFDDTRFKQLLLEETGKIPEWSPGFFADVEQDVKDSMSRIESDPFLTKTKILRGFILSIETGKLIEVTNPR